MTSMDQKIEKLGNLGGGKEARLNMVWQWIKQANITRRNFISLLKEIDRLEERELRWDD
jgi:hypothetical protein